MIFKTQIPASKELLLGSVSDLDILLLFCPQFVKFRKPFKSPIIIEGDNSSNKSAAILPSTSKGPAILYDFRLGQSFNPIKLASIVTGLNYRDTIEYLCSKFGLISGDFNDQKLPSRRLNLSVSHEISPCRIDVKYTDWTRDHLDFWGSFGWEPYMLDRAQIRPIQAFWTQRDGEDIIEYNRSSMGPISFSYDFGELDGIFRRKIYNPTAKNKSIKWRNNTDKRIIQALNTIDYHVDKLYIVSSMKDCGPYWTLLNKPCAVAPNSENTILSPNQIRYLRQISDEQIIWYDNDFAGRMNAQKQSNLYGFKMYEWDHYGKPKDQSDYVKERGLKEFNKLII